MPNRIHIQHLTLGMYLHEFCGSWMDHPFWRARFLLKDPKDLARIQATAIQEIWIDTDKSLDVAEGTASISRWGGVLWSARGQVSVGTIPRFWFFYLYENRRRAKTFVICAVAAVSSPFSIQWH